MSRRAIRKLPARPAKAVERKAIKMAKIEAQREFLEQNARPVKDSNGKALLPLDGVRDALGRPVAYVPLGTAALIITPVQGDAPGIDEDFATVRALVMHLERCAAIAKPKPGNGKAGRPFDWRRHRAVLEAVREALVNPMPAQRGSAGGYRKQWMPLDEQVGLVLDCSVDTARDAIDQMRGRFKGWALRKHMRGRGAVYAMPRLKR